MKNMLLFLLTFYTSQSFAQQKIITCSTQRNTDGTQSIIAESKAYADYTIKLIFTNLAGYSSDVNTESLRTMGPGTFQLAKLTPNTFGNHTFNYRFQYFPGKYFKTPPDTSFTYLMPSTSGSTLQVSKVFSLEERLTQKKPDDFFTTDFKYNLGDTICAARGGTIYECTDDKEGEKANQTFSTNRNRIGIEHKDGTIAHYIILAPIKLLVVAGDKVIPGQPLAVFDRESPKYHVMFSVAYLDEKKLLENNEPGNTSSSSNYIHIPSLFYVGETDKAEELQISKQYKVVQPKQVIAAEMSKKEKKNMGL